MKVLGNTNRKVKSEPCRQAIRKRDILSPLHWTTQISIDDAGRQALADLRWTCAHLVERAPLLADEWRQGSRKGH